MDPRASPRRKGAAAKRTANLHESLTESQAGVTSASHANGLPAFKELWLLRPDLHGCVGHFRHQGLCANQVHVAAERKAQTEYRAAINPVLRPDPAPMSFDDRARDRQAHAHA